MTREDKKVEKFTLYSQELKEMMYPEKAFAKDLPLIVYIREKEREEREWKRRKG